MNIGRNSPVITNLHTQKKISSVHDCLSIVNKVFCNFLKLLENPLFFCFFHKCLPLAVVEINSTL